MCDCESGESRYGKHNGWNSRDLWLETFGERTVLESELKVPSMCENVTTNVFVQFPCSVSCLSFHLRRTCLSLQLVVCFCSVLHRTVYTSARSCPSAHTIHNLVCMARYSKVVSSVQNKSHRHVIHVCTCTWAFHADVFFLDPFIKNNLSGHVADQ